MFRYHYRHKTSSGCQDRSNRIAHRTRTPAMNVDRTDTLPIFGTHTFANDENDVVPPRHYVGWGPSLDPSLTSSTNAVSGGPGPYKS